MITSLPEPNKRHVQCGLAGRIVMAANRFLSYEVNGNKLARRERLISFILVLIWEVDTML